MVLLLFTLEISFTFICEILWHLADNILSLCEIFISTFPITRWGLPPAADKANTSTSLPVHNVYKTLTFRLALTCIMYTRQWHVLAPRHASYIKVCTTILLARLRCPRLTGCRLVSGVFCLLWCCWGRCVCLRACPVHYNRVASPCRWVWFFLLLNHRVPRASAPLDLCWLVDFLCGGGAVVTAVPSEMMNHS